MFWTLVVVFVTYQLVTWALSRIRIKDYQGRYVLITGCDSGFGNLLARHLDTLGFNVFATCLTQEAANSLRKMCSERVTTTLLDVRDEKSIAALRQFVENTLPAGRGLWGLVNNAGVAGLPVPSEWQTQEDWNQCLSVNLFGVINMTRAFLPLLRQGGEGRVVNMSSMMGRIAAAPAPYTVSKFGVEAFSDCLRHETYTQGIKVCLVEPGYFKTEISAASNIIGAFKRGYDKTPDDILKHYQHLTVERFTKIIQRARQNASDDVQLVVNAMTLGLTSRFPPTRQLVGYDARFLGRIMWNLPTPLCDWLFHRLLSLN